MIAEIATVCILTLLGSWCGQGPEPVGSCFTIFDVTMCVSSPEDFGVWASTYDYAACDEYPINCDEDPTVTANGTPTSPELYWNSAACPHDWLGMTIETEFGDWDCIDRGGAVRLDYRQVYSRDENGVWTLEWQVVWIVDFAVPIDQQPHWAYLVTYDWGFVDD